MRRVLIVLIAMGLLVLATVPAWAGGRPLSTELSGANEVGGGDPDGSGTAAITLNQGQEEICLSVSVANVDTVIGGHIHAAPAGVNGGIVVDLGIVSTNTTGCVSASAELIKDIRQQPWNYYINVHTTVFPGGAVRGQLSK